MRLVLLSNSINFGCGYLDHAARAITELFQGARRIAFVPFALADQEGYHERVRLRFGALGLDVHRVMEGGHGRDVLEKSEGIFVGGGNTFRLLDRLQRSDFIALIRSRVLAGAPYLGSSAGTVVAGPTIRTTNDMPIVQPASFEALGLVPFQVNCHYLDPDPASRHMGETREARLREFLEENRRPVVALREGSWLEVAADAADAPRRVRLCGPLMARLYRRDHEPLECPPGDLPAFG
ncbi:MAG TPA: dipeptidase PepE [Candidatus Polarisedimenticolia bacterium]|nr:dipeptidase PepE [Candidatus Polarisedimenticolia bacterium]